MTAEEIFDKVREIIAEEFSVDAESISMNSLLEDDLGADSIDLVELAVALEEEFDLAETEEEVLSEIKSVGDVVDYIGKQLAE